MGKVRKKYKYIINDLKVPSLTLNERLSDAVGMRLAHDTLVRLGKGVSKKLLPWLDLDVSQLFYLVYAQVSSIYIIFILIAYLD